MHVRPFFHGDRRKDHDAVGPEFVADLLDARRVGLNRFHRGQGPDRDDGDRQTGRHHFDGQVSFRNRSLVHPQRPADFVEVLDAFGRSQKLRLGLGHHDVVHLPVHHVQLHGKEADVAFKDVPRQRLRQGKFLQQTQHEKGADHRMAGKRNFLGGGKDTEFDDRRRVRRRHHEDGFREIHLTGDLLEFPLGQIRGVGNHGHGIAAERLFRKRVRRVK